MGARHVRRTAYFAVEDEHQPPADARAEIATALNVSRIPVREAIIALEREGWVTHLVHRGAFVNRVDEDLIRDHYALFGLLYGYAARKVGAAPDVTLLAE